MKNDLELICDVKNGNVEAFSELVMRYQRLLLRMAVRLTKDLESAEDIVQETFFKVYKKINLFEGRSSFKSWVYQIALNTAKNSLRSKRYHQSADETQLLATDSNLDGKLLKTSIRDILQQEIEKLPTKQRTALHLRVFEDLSFKEISEIMECPYDTAKANYRHALIKLKNRFEEDDHLKEWSDFNNLMSINEEYASFVAEVE